MKILKILVALSIMLSCTTYSISKIVEIADDANYKARITAIELAFAEEEIDSGQYSRLLELAEVLDKEHIFRILEEKKAAHNTNDHYQEKRYEE